MTGRPERPARVTDEREHERQRRQRRQDRASREDLGREAGGALAQVVEGVQEAAATKVAAARLSVSSRRMIVRPPANLTVVRNRT